MTDLKADMMTRDEFLEHFGKKGMKWGVTKAKTTNPSHTSADAARANKISSRSKKNGLDNLSNDDLAKLNKRSQLLSEYKKNNPSTVKKGYEATKKAVAVAGTIGTVITIGAKVAKSPLARKGAQAVVDVLKNLQ